MIVPIPIQYSGDDDTFLHAPKFVARPVIDVVFSGAGTDVSVSHTLDRVPLGYFVVGRSGNFVVYNGSVGWTAQEISLAASAAGTAQVLIF
jgi:hypothetical protein